MLPSNFPQGKFSLNIQPWTSSNRGEVKKTTSSPLSCLLPSRDREAVRSLQGTHHLQGGSWSSRRAGGGMADCPHAASSPVIHRLKISSPQSVSASQELWDFSGPNNAAHSLLSSEAQRHAERPLHWYYSTTFRLLPQLLAGVLTFQIPISLETWTTILLCYKEAQVKRSLAGHFPTLSLWHHL